MWRARHVASCAAAAWIGSRASATPGHPALKHGTPISHRTRYDENYVVHFDQRARDPLWVVERLTKQRLDAEAESPPGRRDAKYLEATDVPARLRSRLAHYKHSGFDPRPPRAGRGSQRLQRRDAVPSGVLDRVDGVLERSVNLHAIEQCLAQVDVLPGQHGTAGQHAESRPVVKIGRALPERRSSRRRGLRRLGAALSARARKRRPADEASCAREPAERDLGALPESSQLVASMA